MTKHLRRTVLVAILVVAATATPALAVSPIKGKSYAGTTAHGKASIILRVSKSAKALMVSVASPPLYCQGGGGPTQQVTKPAAISSSGSFSGSIGYRFIGKISYRAYFSGKFVKKTVVKGILRSQYATKQCSGSTSFQAKATAKPAAAL